jgi:hypothetical protein
VLGGLSAAGLGGFARPGLAANLVSQQKRMLVFYMHGGISQLETWDPKPGVRTGGPFRAIPTSVPGLHISELLPHTAKVMHLLGVVRGVNTAEDDHGKGDYLMKTGRRQTPAAEYPVLGAVAAKTLSPEDAALPGHIQISPHGGGGRNADAAYLGPKFSSITLGNGNPPPNTVRPGHVSLPAALDRDELRRKANERFARRRRTAQTDLYTTNYEQAQRLMEQKDVFDVAKESAKDMDRYGRTDIGRHCLLARRLIERGVPYVQVAHSNYDTHNENFDFHLEQVGEFDKPFATLIGDLKDRGLLEHTLVVMMSEFGRTPNINLYAGRDHWSAAWSVLMGGCGLKAGFVHGKTNELGTAVVDGQVDHANLFHTYLRAVGVDSSDSFEIDGRELPFADPASKPIKEILA